MPKVILTDISIRALKPPATGQTTYVDISLAGFGVRVSRGGTKSFTLVYGANRRRASLGVYGTISLAEARKEAKRILAEHTLGKHTPKAINWAAVVEEYLEVCRGKNKVRTVYDYKRLLNRHFRFGREKIADVTKHDITSRLRKLKTQPSEQHHAFVAVRAFFKWAVREGYLEHSPVEGLGKQGKTTSRDRVLSEEELKVFYQHTINYPYPYGPILSLLLLTGQRRGEIAALEWSWINTDERTITLPDTITKNKREHTFPYGDVVASILEDIPETGDLLFPARTTHVRGTSSTTFNGWGKAKKKFDAGLENVAPYTLHDLRRTASSQHAALGTPIHVTEKLLNHISGTISGVAAVYNRHTYMDEMRDAVRAWEAKLQTL